VLRGSISMETIEPFLYEKQFFIPSEVGLIDLQCPVFKGYDHVWHEIIDISPAGENISTNTDANQLLSRFKKASKKNWNLKVVFAKKGLV